jgi:8-oxo-dGTP diphosphatase
MIIVVAGLIDRSGELLITQRLPGKHGAGKWEFPGGKLEAEEDPRECLRREVREELAIEIEVTRIEEVIFHRYPERTVLLLFYRCCWISGEPQALQVQSYAWAKPAQLRNYDFLEADLDFIRRL